MEQQVKISEVIDLAQEQFTKNAPSTMKYSAERGFAIQLLQNNSYLMKVAHENPVSLQQAVANVAAIGLSLNPAEKLAYLIPRTVKINGQFVSKIFLEPSYMGLMKLSTDTGSIKWVQAYPVYANDTFVDNGAGEKPTHTYDAFALTADRGTFMGVYCVAKTADGDFLCTIMSAIEVDGIRDRSESWKKGQFGPWKTDFIEQAKKTVLRRAFKTWPRSSGMEHLTEAVSLSNENEGFEPMLTEPNIGTATASQKQYFDQLIEKSDALGMFVLFQTIDIPEQTTLVNSFPKGKKGQYKAIVNGLIDTGRGMVKEYREQLTEATQINDEVEIERLVNELGEDELAVVLKEVAPDVASVANGFID